MSHVSFHQVKLFDTDCLGVIFFGSQFRYFQEAIELLFEEAGYPLSHLCTNSPFLFVMVHASSDFLQPLRLGDKLEMVTSLEKIGETSLTFSFSLKRGGEEVGRGRTVQVCLNASSRKKEAIPEDLKRCLISVLFDNRPAG